MLSSSRHPRQHEAFDCHAFKRNRQEECVQMPVKIARSTPRPSFGLRGLLVASHISRLASRDAAKSLLSTLVSESSGECRSRATDRRSASKCQGKWPDQTLDQEFGLPEVLVAVSTSRLSCKRAGKTRTLMPGWDSSGESRISPPRPL